MDKIVTQETLIPIGLAVVVIGAVTTFVVETRARQKANEDLLEALKQTHEAHVKIIHEVDARLSRIEWRLEKDSYGSNRKDK
jgi:hypothetical protein